MKLKVAACENKGEGTVLVREGEEYKSENRLVVN